MAGIAAAHAEIAKGHHTGVVKQIRDRDIVIELDSGVAVVRYKDGNDTRVSPLVQKGHKVRLVILDEYSAMWVVDQPIG